MKLYTEEQLRKAIRRVYCSEICEDLTITEIADNFLKSITHIELPNDEEIREERLLQFPDSEYANRANDRLAFYCGAKFVINKIQGGNK